MGEQLLSLGLDVGTTTTQLVLSRLQVENRAPGFCVPRLQITDREIIYRSPVFFTPLQNQSLVDGEKIRRLVDKCYAQAGISKEQVDTGAIIITGETSRKENAAAVLQSLSGYAGDAVAATAGPDLESVLAAKGAGADTYSRETGERVLHIDIGGGTSNMALVEKGNITATGCLNVGGRLVKLEQGVVSYVSPVLTGLTDLQVGGPPASAQLEQLAGLLTQALEMAAGLRPATSLLTRLMTKETAAPWQAPTGGLTLSFSGGVADCIDTPREDFGDIGNCLGQAIRQSALCKGKYRLGTETIRATVIGAGAHSTQLSGSTVFCRNVVLPLKSVPVAIFSAQEQESASLPQLIPRRIRERDTDRVILAFPGFRQPTYAQITALAETLLQVPGDILVCVEGDCAKALGQYLALRLPPDKGVLCIDRIALEAESFLDIGKPVGSAFPVVIKTLVIGKEQKL